MIKDVCAEDFQELRTVGNVVQADSVGTGGPVRFQGAVELMALVQEIHVVLCHVRKQQGLAAVLGDIDYFVQNFVGPRTEVCREDNLFRAGECGKSVAGLFAVVQEADLLHGRLYVGLFDDDQVFCRGVDFFSAILEGELNLVLAHTSRSHEGADSKLGKAGLAHRFFGRLGLGAYDLALFV